MNAKQQFLEICKLLGAKLQQDVSELIEVNGRLFSNMKEKNVYEGKCIGMKGRMFRPSILTLEQISEKTAQKVWLNAKGEFLFTCGRDAWKENITRKTAREQQLVIVLNQHEEPIGIGWYRNGKVENEYDIGDYLRRERRNR
ncbi:hypothetical protein HY483_03365 [Candidatus Woesearchaeota archaeon]|nr:hypothetical protein [Candidatus Woesearchaeota archaeon]